MKRSLFCTAALAVPLLFAAPAIAQTADTPTSSGTLPPAAPPGAAIGPVPRTGSIAAMPPAGGAANLSATDQAFVQKAAEGGIAEVQLAQLAQQKTQNDQVKQFAQKMIDDHTPNNEELVKIATSEGVTPPTEPNAMQQKMAAHLETLSGAKFDRSYIRGQIRAHEMMLKLFQHEAADSQNPQLKSFAEKTVEVIQEHLSMAEQLQKTGA